MSDVRVLHVLSEYSKYVAKANKKLKVDFTYTAYECLRKVGHCVLFIESKR